MKTFLITLCFYLFSLSLIAQNDTIIIEKVYIGALGTNSFEVDSLQMVPDFDARAGIRARWEINKWLDLNGFTAGNISTSGFQVINALGARFKSGNFSLNIGKIPSIPALFHRPNPVSFPGHFETYSTSRAPGGVLGGTGIFQNTKSQTIGFSIGKGFYAFGLGDKVIKMSIWQSPGGFGRAISLTFKKWATDLIVTKNETASRVWIDLSKDLGAYSDCSYNYEKKDLVRGEWGIIRLFSKETYSGLFGLGYSYEIRSVKGYMMIYL